MEKAPRLCKFKYSIDEPKSYCFNHWGCGSIIFWTQKKPRKPRGSWGISGYCNKEHSTINNKLARGFVVWKKQGVTALEHLRTKATIGCEVFYWVIIKCVSHTRECFSFLSPNFIFSAFGKICSNKKTFHTVIYYPSSLICYQLEDSYRYFSGVKVLLWSVVFPKTAEGNLLNILIQLQNFRFKLRGGYFSLLAQSRRARTLLISSPNLFPEPSPC